MCLRPKLRPQTLDVFQVTCVLIGGSALSATPPQVPGRTSTGPQRTGKVGDQQKVVCRQHLPSAPKAQSPHLMILERSLLISAVRGVLLRGGQT
jgi:hypothetical protein